jgi:hypothetical protein
MLHAQGEQITRTHNMAVDMDKDLSKVSSMCCYEIIFRTHCSRRKTDFCSIKKNGEKMMIILKF